MVRDNKDGACSRNMFSPPDMIRTDQVSESPQESTRQAVEYRSSFLPHHTRTRSALESISVSKRVLPVPQNPEAMRSSASLDRVGREGISAHFYNIFTVFYGTL